LFVEISNTKLKVIVNLKFFVTYFCIVKSFSSTLYIFFYKNEHIFFCINKVSLQNVEIFYRFVAPKLSWKIIFATCFYSFKVFSAQHSFFLFFFKCSFASAKFFWNHDIRKLLAEFSPADIIVIHWILPTKLYFTVTFFLGDFNTKFRPIILKLNNFCATYFFYLIYFIERFMFFKKWPLFFSISFFFCINKVFLKYPHFFVAKVPPPPIQGQKPLKWGT